MPFVSDKQRRFLWSQKPEVAKKFAEHHYDGGMAGMDNIKKVTQKDRYGNQISYEFESPVKPIDQTELMKKMMDDMGPVPEMSMEVPEYDHPGEPKGTDTVPAWLTPGEFVVNKEATEIYGDEIKAMNDHGRELQAAKGMEVPGYQTGGDVPFLAGPLLTDPEYAGAGKWITKGLNALTGDLYSPYVSTDEIEKWGDESKSFGHNLGEAKKEKRKEILRENREQRWQEGMDRPAPPAKPLSAKKYIRSGVFNPQYNPQAYAQWKRNLDAYHEQYGKPSFWDKIKYRQEGGWVTDELLDKLMEVESGGDNEAVSPAGAIGKYQWLPSSAKQAGYGVKPFDPKDPKAARAATKKYLENMQKYHGFTPEETLRAYNWGPGNVINYNKGKRKDIPDEALNYPGKILGFENVEGVPVHGEMKVPTPRPFQNGGGVYQDPIMNMVPPEIDVAAELAGEEDIDLPPNVVPELQDVPGNPMYEGDTPTDESGSKWWHSLLGQKSKSDLGLQLDPNEARLYHEANPSLVGDDPIAAEIESDVEGGAPGEQPITDVTGEALVGQVDDYGDNTYAAKEEKAKLLNEDANHIAQADSDSTGEVQTGPGANQPGENTNKKTVEAAGEEAVNADPSLVDQVKGAFSDAFKSLFNPAELAKAAILYAGSRALGYSHGGSMQWVANNYLESVQAAEQAKIKAAATKEKRAFELAKTDKFTPKSVSAYRKSGDPADLVSKKSVAGAIPTGTTEQRIGKNGKKLSIQQVKLPSGAIGYQLPNGKLVNKAQLENISKPYDAALDPGTSQYKTRKTNTLKSMTEFFKEIQSREDRFTVDKETKYRTGIYPQQAAQDFWTFAEKYGVNPESNEAQDLIGQAYRQAIEQSKNKDAPVAKDLKPFLEAQYIRQQTGNPQLFQVNPDKEEREAARFVRSDLMAKFLNKLDNASASIPSLQGMKPTDQRNQLVDTLVNKWGALSEEEKKQWNRKANKGMETGFYKFAVEEADDFLVNRKLGE